MENKEFLILLGLLAAVFVIALLCWRGSKKSQPRDVPQEMPPQEMQYPQEMNSQEMHHQDMPRQRMPPQEMPEMYQEPPPQTNLMDQQYGGMGANDQNQYTRL